MGRGAAAQCHFGKECEKNAEKEGETSVKKNASYVKGGGCPSDRKEQALAVDSVGGKRAKTRFVTIKRSVKVLSSTGGVYKTGRHQSLP